MLTIRFPTGLVVTYNAAIRVRTFNGCFKLYSDVKCEQWIASISLSSGAIVESQTPCSIRNSLASVDQLDQLTQRVDRYEFSYSEICALSRLKTALNSLNARKKEWK